MTDHTAHFRFEIPDFLQDPWHAELENALRSIDTAIYEALLVQNVSIWLNSTVYAVGAIVIDSATGLMWTCAVANTSSASPTTFAQERVAHPTFWNATANIPQQRGTWTTATSYIPGDFVVDTNRYAVCLVAHVSGVFNTDLAAAKWVILVDLSALGVGLNATAEDTIAAAATTNIGSKTATRLSVTGAAAITSFGVVANTYKILRFAAGSTLTNSVNLILFSADIVTEVNDVAFFSSDATGKWRCYFYSRASGVPIGQPDASETVKGIAELATQAEVDAAADALRIVTPATLGVRLAALNTSIINTLRNGVGATLDTLKEIADAIGFLAPIANPTFTGTATIPTADITNINVTGAVTLPAGSVESADLEAKARAFGTQRYHIIEAQASGVDGAALVSIGAWNTAPLNAEQIDDLTITPSGNQLPLAAGTYYVEAEGTAFYTGTMDRGTTENAALKLRLRNITDGATLVVGLSIRFSILDDGGGNNQAAAFALYASMRGWFTIAGTKTVELQKWVNNSFSSPAITGGKAVSSGESEVYSDLRLWKIG
jgi:hypothetical protein